MAFERYIPPKTSAARPKATIRPSGLISFDAAAVEAFGLESASHAILFFDKIKKIVGVQMTSNPSEKGSIKLSRRRRSVSLKSPQFFEQYGLTLEEPQKFDAAHHAGDQMVTINLKSVQRRRGRRPKIRA